MAHNSPAGTRSIQESLVNGRTRPQPLSLLLAMLLGFGLGGQLSAEEEQWTSIGPPGMGTVHSLVILPNSAETIYAGTGAGIFKSIDRGQTWTQINSGLTSFLVFALAIDPGAPLTVYAGTQTGGVFRSSDGGATWTALNNGLPVLGNVRALAIDASSGIVYAGTSRGVFKISRGGASWTAANDGLTDLYVLSLVLDPTSPLTVYAGTGSGVFKSNNGGGNWVSVYGRVQEGILALGHSSYPPATVYAGTYYSGPTVVGSATGNGILKSADSGINWSYANNGLPSFLVGIALAVDPLSPSLVYAGTSSGVFRSLDLGASWTAVTRGLTHLNALSIAIDEQGTVYAGTGAGVFRLSKGASCSSDFTTLCLNGGRFRVQVAWRALHIGTSGAGQGVPLTSDAGYFWFFTSNNVELVIKVVDGRPVNGRFWMFVGALSDVEYTITVTDTQTGAIKTYQNPQGRLASIADTAAF